LATPSIFKIYLFIKEIAREALQKQLMGREKPSITTVFSAAVGRDIENILHFQMSQDS